MDIHESCSLLHHYLGTEPCPVSTRESNATTGWGVNWSEEMIARDLLQNFYDANREQLEQVEITLPAPGTVRLFGPVACNLEQLFYLGSEKGPDDIGEYGEGFKVAATCLLRDHRVNPLAASGRQALAIRMAPHPVAGTNLYPLLYDFFTLQKPLAGTVLILPGCSGRLTAALRTGLNHFFSPANSLLGSLLWSHREGTHQIYASTTSDGHIFYRNLKRGQFSDIPVVLVMNREYAAIEKLIAHDRDRNAFGEKVLTTFYKQFARNLRGYVAPARALVEAARGCWERGHPLLAALASESYFSLSDLFGETYFARSASQNASPAELLRIQEVERAWEQEGRHRLPGYFTQLGATSAISYLDALDKKAREEAYRTQSHPPTMAEQSALRLLEEILHRMAPDIAGVLEHRKVRYTVAETEVLLGELKQENPYQTHTVFLAAQLFVADFAQALATFTHEHAHLFGYDGSRGFTDALTRLMETLIRCRATLDEFESRWLVVQAAVLRERSAVGSIRQENAYEQRLAAMDEETLRRLLRQLPQAQLQRLLDKESTASPE